MNPAAYTLLFPVYAVPPSAFAAGIHTVRYEFQGGTLTIYLDGMLVCCAPIFVDNNGDPLTLVGTWRGWGGGFDSYKILADWNGNSRWSQNVEWRNMTLYHMNQIVPAGNIPTQAGGYYRRVIIDDQQVKNIVTQVD